MTTVTLDAIEAEHNRIGQLIEQFKSQHATAVYHFPEALITLQPGEHYAGLIIGQDGQPSYHLVLLPGELESANWNDAVQWAGEQEGKLPDRREQSLLYANLKDQFKPEWYWSSQDHESVSGYAWCQYFYHGGQSYDHKCSELRARAVRRLIIE
jgi:hypothetical protein